MNLFDRRLYQSRSLQDFLFRLRWNENEPHRRAVRQRENFAAVIDFTSFDPSRVYGIDISHWNGVVNLALGKAMGLSFVIIKGCDGTINSRYFPENKAGAQAAGLPWGVYVWLYPGSKVPVGLQTQAWWDLVKNDYPPLGVWVDFEWTSYAGAAANPNAGDLTSALDKFQALSGRRMGIYSAKGYTDQYLAGFPNPDNETWWIANYGVAAPALPRGVTKYKFWQFTDTIDAVRYGSDPLIAHAFDGNYYSGTRAEFTLEYGTPPTDPPPVEPPTGGNMSKWWKVNTTALNIRRGAAGADIGDLLKNDIVETDDTPINPGGWYHILTWMRGTTLMSLPDPVNSWCSGSYLVAIAPPAEPPPPPPDTDDVVTLKSWSITVNVNGVDHTFSG